MSAAPAHLRHVNETCACTSLDREALRQSLAVQPQPELFEALPETHPHLFADTPVYVSRLDMEQMLETVAAIERVATSPAYRQATGARTPAIALRDFGPRGALMGYDFHLGEAGPRLIEINTNAGGAFLNGIACEAQRVCCEAMQAFGRIACPDDLATRLAAMFVAEWRLQRGTGTPGLVAIVDDRPEEQYLYPEFLIAQALLQSRGLPTVIADPGALTYSEGRLWFGAQPIDLVYNRLVDFDFSLPAHTGLRDAYAAGDVVVTPNPHHHSALADKRNLITLAGPGLQAGLDAADRLALARIPRTEAVTAENAEALWAARSGLFFKPVAGHGGKAVYRGDKVTRKVWATIVAGGYVAQERVAPSERVVARDGERTRHKLDVRLYTYGGDLLLAAARLYQGQTTNFRTPGGGFAPVFVV